MNNIVLKQNLLILILVLLLREESILKDNMGTRKCNDYDITIIIVCYTFFLWPQSQDARQRKSGG